MGGCTLSDADCVGAGRSSGCAASVSTSGSFVFASAIVEGKDLVRGDLVFALLVCECGGMNGGLFLHILVDNNLAALMPK